ncbi:MAG: c-type cytochrome [Candidatus Omnitrophota bacterium]
MRDTLLFFVQIGVVLFALSGALALVGGIRKKAVLSQVGLLLISIIGPATLILCWRTQVLFRAEDGVFWARLMAGDASLPWSIGSMALITASGLAVGALALGERSATIYAGAFFLASSWTIAYLHPTPHYVPMPPWADKLVWFALLVGGAVVSIIVYKTWREKLKIFHGPLLIAASVFSFASVSLLAAHDRADDPIDLSQMGNTERIAAMGCLSCHRMGEEGPLEPGGALDSVASRREDAVLAFLLAPTAEEAVKLGIRQKPTGDMAGVKLTPDQAGKLMEALKALFKIQPPSMLGPGHEAVEAILADEKHTCLACHSVKGLGAAQGIGGPLENAAKRSEEVLIQWLMQPTAENAAKLKIREQPMGAMASFALTEEETKIVAAWLITLQ